MEGGREMKRDPTTATLLIVSTSNIFLQAQTKYALDYTPQSLRAPPLPHYIVPIPPGGSPSLRTSGITEQLCRSRA